MANKKIRVLIDFKDEKNAFSSMPPLKGKKFLIHCHIPSDWGYLSHYMTRYIFFVHYSKIGMEITSKFIKTYGKVTDEQREMYQHIEDIYIEEVKCGRK